MQQKILEYQHIIINSNSMNNALHNDSNSDINRISLNGETGLLNSFLNEMDLPQQPLIGGYTNETPNGNNNNFDDNDEVSDNQSDNDLITKDKTDF